VSRRALFRVLTLGLILVGGLGAVEHRARSLNLDARQGRLIATTPFNDGSLLGLDYLPTTFSLDHAGFTSAWGRCDFDHPRSWLVLGDSTTAQPHYSVDQTWPSRLRVPDDVQLCVIAEDGYDPRDYVGLLEGMDTFSPERIGVLLCENDLGELIKRTSSLQDGVLVLHEPVERLAVYAPLYYPRIFELSVAFRFVHWRLAGDPPEHWAPQHVPGVQAGDALRQVVTRAPTTLWYLPRLEEAAAAPVASLEVATGLPVTVIRLENPAGGRLTPEDTIHLNASGHAEVARLIEASW